MIINVRQFISYIKISTNYSYPCLVVWLCTTLALSDPVQTSGASTLVLQSQPTACTSPECVLGSETDTSPLPPSSLPTSATSTPKPVSSEFVELGELDVRRLYNSMKSLDKNMNLNILNI